MFTRTLLVLASLAAIAGAPARGAEFLETAAYRPAASPTVAWKFSDANGQDIWIDRNGKQTAAPAPAPEPRRPTGFAKARPYSEGLAAVDNGADGGYADEAGTLQPQRFRACGDFHDHLAKVVTAEGSATYVTEALAPIHAGMPASEDSPGLWFGDGLAPMRDGKSLLWGFIDAQGHWAIAPQFQVVGSFREGLAPVEQLDSRDRLRLGFIDRTGKLVIPYKFASQAATGHWIQFSDGRAIVADPARFRASSKGPDGMTIEDPRKAWHGVIGTRGRWVSRLRFQSCGDCVFKNGRAQAFGPGQKLIDTAGRVVWSRR
jgi:hypothetical protein